ncbi:MAG: FAD-dependent oxidoreductase [Chloroflexota bacterium]
MIPPNADIVICGAGIAGISAAYHLAVRRSIGNILLIEAEAPLTMTSDKSTEAYRNWWPGPGDTMVRFMNRSIDLLEELAEVSDNYFHLNRRGYVFLTADPARANVYEQSVAESSQLGPVTCGSIVACLTIRFIPRTGPKVMTHTSTGLTWCWTQASFGSVSRLSRLMRLPCSTPVAAAG